MKIAKVGIICNDYGPNSRAIGFAEEIKKINSEIEIYLFRGKEIQKWDNNNFDNLENADVSINILIHHTGNEIQDNLPSNIDQKNIHKIISFNSDGQPIKEKGQICIFRRIYNRNAVLNHTEIKSIFDHIQDINYALPDFCEEYFSPEVSPETNEHINYYRNSCLKSTKEYPEYIPLIGGLRPLIWVFDDYSYYLKKQNPDDLNHSLIEQEINQNLAHNYSTKQNKINEKEMREILQGYQITLNNLSVAFDVQASPLWIGGDKPTYANVAAALPMERLHELRSRIAAFVVDLEWLPLPVLSQLVEKRGWANTGHTAIHILKHCFQEIPCFVYTGEWELTKIQEGFVYGADWCFRKGKTHHPYSIEQNGVNESFRGDDLHCLNLQQYLAKSAQIAYGAFRETHRLEQLVIDPGTDAGCELLGRLNLRLPLAKSAAGQNLQRLIATLFPNATTVKPVLVLGSGKSKAQATFLVRPEENGSTGATRFVKIGPWPTVLREYLAYHQVIHPHLNSHVATILERPVTTSELVQEPGTAADTDPAIRQRGTTGMPQGALVYTLAGFPEGHQELASLDKWIRRLLSDPSGGAALATKITTTLERVLRPLYESSSTGTRQSTSRDRPLWEWLGKVLPPPLTGRLVSLAELAVFEEPGPESNRDRHALRCNRTKGYKDDVAWLLAASQLKKCPRHDRDERDFVWLENFLLEDVNWSAQGDGELLLVHPDLGMRIHLRGKVVDIRDRFGMIWVRPGLSITVAARLDATSEKVEDLRHAVNTAANCLGFKGLPPLPDQSDLFDVLQNWKVVDLAGISEPSVGRRFIDPAFTITARQGAIHGDLNLENILFAGQEQVGWLIDFENAQEDGMVAYDLAKLEAEIWNHHVFRVLKTLAQAFFLEDWPRILLDLLIDTLIAGEETRYCQASGEARLRRHAALSQAPVEVFTPLRNLLAAISAVRRFALDTLRLNPAELYWALGGYFLVSIKFSSKSDEPWRTVCGWRAAAWYWQKVLPVYPQKQECKTLFCPQKQEWETLLEQIGSRASLAKREPQADGLLLEVARTGKPPAKDGMDALVLTMSENRKPVKWPSEITERWDIASTGCVANMTPIIGHLWLRVKAAQSKTGNQFSIVAPKISSRGASCGTVDILESGGATFISDPVAVVETCHREGSVLCRQDKRLTPIDEVLMERRRHTNTMKNAAWVYASILAKKIALGCTHAIIDVKVGRDSKMLAPWQKDGGKSLLDTQADAELVASNRLETFQSLLKSMGVTGLTCHDGYLEQSCAGKLSTLQKIRWIMTNADMPQCRAVGRQLILLHMDQLITGNREKLLHDDEGNNLYRNWYRKHLPCVCGLEPSEANWQALHAQWAQLKKNSLPYLTKGQFNSHPFFASDNEDADNKEIDRKSDFSASSLEKSLPLNEFAHDLSLLTLPLGPYLADSRSEQPVTIRQIDAYRLDLLFEWLCGDDRYDPEVGIWLHKLPGEVMENPKEKPFISIFYRPSRHTEQAVAQRVRDLIWFGVKVKQPED